MKNSIYILVVDKDPAVIKSVWRELNHEGYSVEGALDGKKAIHRFGQNNYDLVFTDLAIPEIDGITLIKWMRQFRPAIGIVVLTDDLLQEPLKEAHKLGIIGHMRKPFTPGTLKVVTNLAIESIKGNALENTPEEEFAAPMLAELDKVIHQYRENSGHIIYVLLQAQDIFGYLPSMIQKRIAQGMKICPSEILSIVSSNSCFRTKPGSDHSPCYMGRREKIWRDVAWMTDRRAINAVNEFIKGRESGYLQPPG